MKDLKLKQIAEKILPGQLNNFKQEFDLKDFYWLGRAIAGYYSHKGFKSGNIFIARDARKSSLQLSKSLAKGFSQSGFGVLDVGVCPTPVISSFVKKDYAKAGVVVTASHNPSDYNGVKIYLDGQQVWGKEILKIKEIFKSNDFQPAVLCKVLKTNQPKEKYLKALSKEFNFEKLKIAWNIGIGIYPLKEIGIFNNFFIICT